MSIRLVLFFFLLSGFTFAQRYGVDLGYAYTINQMKLERDDYPVSSEENFTKQYLFPNFSVRPYVHLHNRFFLYAGADFVKYEFSQYLHFNDPEKSDYKVHWMVSEIQAPVMLRWQATQFNDKHRLSFYGGLFARIMGTSVNKGFTDIVGGGSSYDIEIKTRLWRYTNMVIGAQQTLNINKWMDVYADVQLKYMPSYYYCRANPYLMFLSLSCKNKFAFSFSLGVSLFKPSYQKQSPTSASRLED